MRLEHKLAAELGLPLALAEKPMTESELDERRTFIWVAKVSADLPDSVLYEKFSLLRHSAEEPVKPGQQLLGWTDEDNQHGIRSFDVVQYGERLLVPATSAWAGGMVLRRGEERKGSVKLAHSMG